MADSHKYDASSIKILEGLEAVRQRPGMYIGSTDRYGLHHLVYEIVDNSVDEALAGHCTEIEIILEKDGYCTVIDNGRGIPIGMHDKAKIPAVEVVLTTLHAGGKFDKGGYKVSGGLHGVGSSVVNALSETFKVEVHREKKVYTNTYHKGIPVKKIGELKDEAKQKITGTIISFYPDKSIFETLDFSFDTLATRFKETAYLNKGLKIIFTDLREKTEKKEIYCFEGGVVEYVEHIDENKEALFKKPLYIHKELDNVDVEVSLHYCKDYYDETMLTFVNNIRTREGGTHLSGFRTALTRSINNFAKKYELLNLKKDELFTGNDVREGLTAIVSIKVPEPQFEGQTKSKLGNSEVKGIVDSVVDAGLTDAFETTPAIGKAIVNKCLVAQRVRNATRNAQDLARRKSALEGSSLPGKLADCINRDPSKCEVYIVEGDSAGGSAKQGRDRNFQAILPLRGKILNVEKASLDKILENEELKNMISAFGPEVIEKLGRSREETEEEAEAAPEAASQTEIDRVLQYLRYHKIIIMTDADVDGAHIRTLLLTFFYRYAKKVIEAGCIYAAQPPLYLIKKGKTQQYAYSDEEKDKIVASFGKDANSVGIQRYKGLGEMNPEQLWSTTMDPANRILLQMTLEDAVRADEIFTLLMGSEVEPRKKFIQERANSVKWLDI
ncbi:DNA gyrase subunit B [Candidatus Termititenax dinenymphae]|uniref:DNA gyrase subunit B n=1 Tax=Candidatus Termititenax dinenymphae TaxID=2218523 RepID=A0A388TK28_9BACT|nr:DNA gyrase subunit B [Candidatus Termititenax dinenymphae]